MNSLVHGQTHNRSVLGNLGTINRESRVRYSSVAALQAPDGK